MIREATNIVGDIKGIASTGVRAVRTRLELLAIELKEEKAWLVRFVVVAIAALYLLTFGLLLAIFALALSRNLPGEVAIAVAVGLRFALIVIELMFVGLAFLVGRRR